MKIVMLGPVYPYKGGIAQYTGAMCGALAGEHEVKAVSFSMQYPKLLVRRPQKNEQDTALRFDPAEYSLNTINPVSWRRTADLILEEKPDLLIVQWWHPWFAPCYSAVLRSVRRRSGRAGKRIPVIILCHNVLPHEGFPLKEALTRNVLKQGDAFIVHSGQDEEDLKRLREDPLFVHTVLPAFGHFKQRNLSRAQARAELGIPETQEMLLFFGYIREYKGLKHLIRALPAIHRARPDAHLYVVGDFFDNNREEYLRLIEETGAAEHLTIVEGYLPDDRVEPYFAAADLCVLPYESATQSAVIQTAYSFELPVVATAVGGLPEVVRDDRTGYLVPPKDPDAIAGAVVRFFEENRAEAFREGIRGENARYSWDRMTEHIDALAEKLRERYA